MDFEIVHKPTDSGKDEHYQSTQSDPSLNYHPKSQNPKPTSSHSGRDSIYNKHIPSHQSASQHSPSRHEHLRSGGAHGVSDHYPHKQESLHSSHRLRSTSRDRNCRIESDDDSDNDGSKLVSRPARSNATSPATPPAVPTKPKSRSNPNLAKKSAKARTPSSESKEPKPEDEDEEDEGEVMEDEMPRAKPGKMTNKTLATSPKPKADAPSLEEVLEEEPVKDISKRNKSPEEKEPKGKPEKVELSIQERARRKMRPPPEPRPEPSQDETEPEPEPNENEPQQDEKDDEVRANFRSKPMQSVTPPESKIPEDSSKVATEPKRGRKVSVLMTLNDDLLRTQRAASHAEDEDGDEGGNLSTSGYQPLGDGMRVVKTTRMTVKIPNPGAVATRTRQRTK
ncbi:hypothetical protein RSAG8_01504, partial [Rhizoctonia solani AG-8 WAC10335]